MSSLFIGVDISGSHLRFVALDAEKGPPCVKASKAGSFADPEELAALLRELFAGDFSRPRRVVAAVPANKGFFRQLRFPFGDSRKIASALAFEFGSHLPVDLGACIIASQSARAVSGEDYQVAAAAVPRDFLEDFIAPFEEAGVPLHAIDLAPFACAAGLNEDLRNSLVVSVSHEETTVALVQEGRIADYALRPHGQEQDDAGLHQYVLSRCRFYKQRNSGDVPVVVMGSRPVAGLTETLEKAGHRVVAAPHAGIDGELPEPEFAPALLLALGAWAGKNHRSFNFRQGPLAMKNDWSAMKRQFYVSGVLTGLALMALTVSLGFNYATRTGTLKRLDQRIQGIYQEALPGSKNRDNILPRMQSHLIALEKKGAAFRIGRMPSPLEVFKNISKSFEGIDDLNLRSYFYDTENIRLEGSTASFEAVNRMSSGLKKSGIFEDIEITEAKMSLDGKHVNFRLNLTLGGGLFSP